MEYKIKHLETTLLGGLDFSMFSDGSLEVLSDTCYDEYSFSPQEVRDLIDFLVKNTNVITEE